jgi:hypothetical protein
MFQETKEGRREKGRKEIMEECIMKDEEERKTEGIRIKTRGAGESLSGWRGKGEGKDKDKEREGEGEGRGEMGWDEEGREGNLVVALAGVGRAPGPPRLHWGDHVQVFQDPS